MSGTRSIPARCARVVDSGWFTAVIFAVIVLNAAVLGAETYEGFYRRHAGLLDAINNACLAIFVVELVIRITSYGRRPQDFFRSGWNVFDFVVIVAGFTPGLGRDTTILRMLRLARVVRVVTLLPDLRILMVAIGRSVPPVASLAVMAVLLVYVYGIIGWVLFAEEIPERWGNIGTAMLNLFVMLTLENLPDNMDAGMAVHPWSWIYFVSFALVASFLLLNILIGVVINSMEEARAIEHQREREERMAARAAGLIDEQEMAVADARDQAEAITRRLSALRDALEDLEEHLGPGRAGAPKPSGHEAPPGR